MNNTPYAKLHTGRVLHANIDGILPKAPYPPCLRMADRALLAGYPRYTNKHDIHRYRDFVKLHIDQISNLQNPVHASAFLEIYGLFCKKMATRTLHWRHNDHGGVSNQQPRGCLPNRLFRRRWKKTSKLRVTGLCVGNSPGPVNSPHKGPVTWKLFPFDDVIMKSRMHDDIEDCQRAWWVFHIGFVERFVQDDNFYCIQWQTFLKNYDIFFPGSKRYDFC